jgi:hypothetical protein
VRKIKQAGPSPITNHWKETAELAWAYSEDGAFHSAARIMTKLAEDMRAHANRVLGEERSRGPQ